jgi:hypothetical protein
MLGRLLLLLGVSKHLVHASVLLHQVLLAVRLFYPQSLHFTLSVLNYFLEWDEALVDIGVQLLDLVVALGKFLVERGAHIIASDRSVVVGRLQVVNAALAEVGLTGAAILIAVVVAGQFVNGAGLELAEFGVRHFNCFHFLYILINFSLKRIVRDLLYIIKKYSIFNK